MSRDVTASIRHIQPDAFQPVVTVATEEPGRLEVTATRFHWLGFVHTVSALCYSVVDDEPHTDLQGRCAPSLNAVVNFVLGQHVRMPDYLRAPLFLLTVLFDCAGLWHAGTLFHRQRPAVRRRQIEAWRHSRLAFARDFIRLYQSLALFAWYSMLADQAPERDARFSSEPSRP